MNSLLSSVSFMVLSSGSHTFHVSPTASLVEDYSAGSRHSLPSS